MAITFQYLRNKVGLVVEDEVHARGIMVSLLKANGVSVQEASHGKEALTILNAMAQTPDFIITDLAMPVMDGWELIATLKSNPFTRSVPIIALTAMADQDSHRRALEAGCDQFLNKPVLAIQFTNELVELLKRFDVASS
ncbi:MAG: response regulator [Phototrophicaceae bacterium]